MLFIKELICHFILFKHLWSANYEHPGKVRYPSISCLFVEKIDFKLRFLYANMKLIAQCAYCALTFGEVFNDDVDKIFEMILNEIPCNGRNSKMYCSASIEDVILVKTISQRRLVYQSNYEFYILT